MAATTAASLAALVGIGVSVGTSLDPWWVWLAVQTVGLSFTSVGLVVWLRYPDSRVGQLMIAVGATWYIVDLRYSNSSVAFTVGYCGFYLSLVVFAHLMLALPTGRLAGRPERVVVAALHVWSLGMQILRYVAERPTPPQTWTSAGLGRSIWPPVAGVGGFALTAVAMWLMVLHWRRAPGPARLSHSLVWVAGALAGLVIFVTILAGLLDASTSTRRLLAVMYVLGLALAPVGILAGLVRVRVARGRVADLIMQLDVASEPRQVRAALAWALCDPDLEVVFRLPGAAGYVDIDGHLAEIPSCGDRMVTTVRRHGEELAALVHHPLLSNQRGLVDAVVIAAGVALENARFLAGQRRLLEEGGASRAPIVALADFARHHVPRDPLERLSSVERRVLDLMAGGLSNSAIAERLHYSVKTVEKRIGVIIRKLGLAESLSANRSDHNVRVLAVLAYLRQAHRPDTPVGRGLTP